MLSLRTLRRAVTASLAAALITAGSALADFVPLDADHVAGDAQNFVDLGAVEPGAVLHPTVTFELVCSGVRHADPGQTVLLHQGMTVVPDPDLFGGSISATDATIGPVPSTWANDTHGGVSCPTPAPPHLPGNEPSTVTITAPFAPGNDYELTLFFDKTLSPPGVNDFSSVAGATGVTYRLDVVDVPDVDTTPPVLHDVPTGIELTTMDPAGALLDYTPPTATDDRDPAPTVQCVPAPGDLAPVGASEVTCTASDATGNTASASFPVMVHLASVLWEEPVGGGSLSVHGDRSVPVKVDAWLDGVAVVDGSLELVVTTCGGDPVDGADATLEYQADAERWMGHLDTSDLAVGCYVVTVMVGDVAYGSFQLDVGAATPTRARGPKAS